MRVTISSARRVRRLFVAVVIMGVVALIKRVLKHVRRGGAVLAVRVRANELLVAVPQLVHGQQPVLGTREEGIRWKSKFADEKGTRGQRHARQ